MQKTTSNFCFCFFILLLNPLLESAAFSQQPVSPLVESYASYQRNKAQTQFGLEWISVGPVVNSARVESVQLDPSKPGTIYVAFGSGNLWKSTNNGMTWEPKFEEQNTHGIGDIALAPSNPDIIYLGTGESLKKARNFTIPGTGIYRSDNGGDSWRHLGLSDSWHIGEIAVHPTDPDIAIVAVLGHFWSENSNRGLFRTDDGGKTWKHVLKVNERTGGNDVVWAKDNPDIVYASTWENSPGVAGEESGIYRSSDSGVTWEKCKHGLPSSGSIGRIGLAVSQTNSDKVYALIDDRSRIKEGAAQVFQSIDGGRNWERTHKDDLQIFSRIGWYFADIYVNPKNDDEVFGLGVRVAHSTDGGKNFDLLSGKVTHMVPSAASGLHLDHCEMWIHPENPNHIVLGNDGGLYQSYDKGATWLHFNNLPTGEFYDIAVDNNSPYKIYAGAQDDATVFGHATELGSSRLENWEYLWIDPWNGGDGCITQVDPTDSNTVYFSAQEGAFRRKNIATNRSTEIYARLPREHSGKLRFNFVAPLFISPHDSKTLYLGGNYLFKSTNRGDDWTVINEDISESENEQRQSVGASAIAESPLERGLLYVGTDKGVFWVSEDGGLSWDDRTNIFLPSSYIRTISPSRHAPDRVYVSATGINYDNLQTDLYYSEDRGVSWNGISSNLENEPANVLVEDPVHEDVLYAGTFRGVYISTDRGGSWSLLGRNLPATSVSDIVIQERENDLIVSTHGRGIYKLNLAPLYEHLSRRKENLAGNHLFPIPNATRPYLDDTRPGDNFRSFEKTPITFWLDEAGSVTLSIFSEDDIFGDAGKHLASFERSATKGLNQFRWDLVLDSQTSQRPYFINYKKYLPKGSYRIQIETADQQTLEQEFTVVDPTESE